jgi:hypothetical protein
MAQYETIYRLVPPPCTCGSRNLEQTRGDRKSIERTSIQRMRCRDCGRAWTRYVEPITLEELVQKLAADGAMARMIGHATRGIHPG